jgi:hypothetical protein
MTPSRELKPSISVRIWFRVCSCSVEPPTAERPSYGVELVYEDYGGRGLTGLPEQVSHAAGAHAHDHLHELGGAHTEERHPSFAGYRPSQERLACTWSPNQQNALRGRSSETRVPLWLPEEVHDLDELVLGLLDVGDVLEGDPLSFLLVVAPGAAPAEAAEGTPETAPLSRSAPG